MKASIAIALAFALLLSLSGCGVGDGAFNQSEYQITFVTRDGIPIDGVQLELLDKSENIRYGYPVTDYYEGSVPTSDANGMITFHHVQYFLEFGGAFFFGCSTGGPPEFDLLFTRKGKLIYWAKYIDLDEKATGSEVTITRNVSIYDEESAKAAWHSDYSKPPRIVERSLAFRIVEQKVVVENQ